MKVKYIGFGGGYAEYPCYEDEKGKLYFDLNDGRGELNLHTGAYRHPEDKDICGEPNTKVKDVVECDKPFQRHKREMDYMLLGRWESDCRYFLGNGNGYEGHLYFNNIEKHISEMKKMWLSFEEKPEWLSMENIEMYERDMLNLRNQKEMQEV